MTPPLSSIILGIQGALLVFNGIASLVSDSWVQMNTKAMELDSNTPAFHALTMASATIGVFYLRMARKNDFTTMWQCVAGRALAFTVFLVDGGVWKDIAKLEAVFGGAQAAALVWEGLRESQNLASRSHDRSTLKAGIYVHETKMANEVTEIDGGPVWYRNNPANKLGESPIYRASDSTLHWVDIHSTPCTIHILPIDPITGDAVGTARILEVPFDSITVIRFRRDVPGSYICGYRLGIAYLDEMTGEVEVLKELIEKEDREEMTMNDGGVDPQGRFWVGSVDLKALRAGLGGEELPKGYGEPRGNLWRYEADGTVTVLGTGITCGNGIGWSPDGKYMFFNDSVPQITWRYDFDGKTGDILNRKKIIDKLPNGVLNDGMVIDQEGNLWIAMWMLHCVKVYSPEGKLLRKINFPAKCVTCPTWGGRDNDILFIASAPPLVEKAAPGDEGGHVFRYKDGVTGMMKYEFTG